MKTIFWFLCLLPVAAASGAETRPALTVAVFDFEASSGVARSTGQALGELVGVDLSARPDLVVVERAELKKLLAEQGLGLSGVATPESASHVGRLTGARVLISGRVFRADSSVVVIAKVMGVETGRVFGEMVEGGREAGPTELAAALSAKIADTLASQGAALAPPPPPADQRLERLVALCRGKRLPVLAVSPGSLALLAQKCGFALTDGLAARRPEIEISGQSSHAREMKQGSLVGEEARIEVRVRDVATGNILAVDRQVSRGLDLSEALAAEQAEQAAALDLAERIFPLLAH